VRRRGGAHGAVCGALCHHHDCDQQFVATGALGSHILAHGRDIFAGNDLGADGGLDRDLELLAREEFLEFKTMYAKRLAGGSSDPKIINAAERKASEQYNVLKDAASDYVGKKYGPDVKAQWAAANGAYAQSVSALDSDVVSLLSNQDFQGFFKKVKAGGKNSPAWKQLNQYADFLSGVSQKAIAAGTVNPADLAVADNFRQHIYAAMMKGMLDNSLVDGARKVLALLLIMINKVSQ
jgi:hypothetical protein